MPTCERCRKPFEMPTRGNGKAKRYCSRSCMNNASVVRRRQRLKLMAIEYLGGKCALCGYSRSVWAMDCHHRNPSEKEFGIAQAGNTRSWVKIKTELDKCVLLCKNCHAEVNAGVVEI
jgi:hypothetical protein